MLHIGNLNQILDNTGSGNGLLPDSTKSLPEPMLTKTRTTRMPAFWDTPATSWLPTLVIPIRCQVKRKQSQSYKSYEIAKNSNFRMLQATLHVTHLLKLFDKMCKYEMDPIRTVGPTEWTRDAGQTDRQTDWRTEWNQYGGYNHNENH